jgi:hypothetical protein
VRHIPWLLIGLSVIVGAASCTSDPDLPFGFDDADFPDSGSRDSGSPPTNDGGGGDASTDASADATPATCGNAVCDAFESCKNCKSECCPDCAPDPSGACAAPKCLVGKACCTPPTPPAGQQFGGMTYTNWTFGGRLSSVETRFCVHQDPGANASMYYQFYDFKIDDTGNYHGIQATSDPAHPRMLIFSRFGTTDLTNVRVEPGSFTYAGTNEGPYVSLRRDFPWAEGCYRFRVARAEADGERDWFDFYAAVEGQKEIKVGGVRFDRKVAGTPATYEDGGGSWVEAYDAATKTQADIPSSRVSWWLTANGGTAPTTAKTTYSKLTNSDVAYDAATKLVHHTTGGMTPRCHPAGPLF